MPPICEALHQSCASLGTILFTITRLDPAAGLVWRDYTSHPAEYPAQGTKPLDKDDWYDACIGARKTFVANTPEGFSAHFFDAALILSMGLGSVINIPVADDTGEVRLTVNLLAGPGHYTDARVAEYERLVAAARGELIGAL